MQDSVRSQISDTIQKNPVVLFMKGNRRAPQCGFSAQVVRLLDALLDDYATVDVLADAEIREGIKTFSDWPTIPQLYVKGEFVGGCDIVKDLAKNGELQKKLGVTPAKVPQITITPSALAALAEATTPNSDDVLHLEIDAGWATNLGFGPRDAGEIETKIGSLTVAMDGATARRAEGLKIDYLEGQRGGFKIDNPQAPPPVKALSPEELKALLDKGPLELYDVRTPAERSKASIAGSRLLDETAAQRIATLDKSAPLYFFCHHGSRSQSAAEHFRQEGHTHVFNLAGGIEAWSTEVDSSVPRY